MQIADDLTAIGIRAAGGFLLFLMAFALLGAGVYFAVSTLLTNAAREVIRADAGGLMQMYHEGGRMDLVTEVRDRADEPDDPDAEYALVARDGRIVAGTFSVLPRWIPKAPRWIELRVRDLDDGSVSRAIANVQPLRDGVSVNRAERDGFQKCAPTYSRIW